MIFLYHGVKLNQHIPGPPGLRGPLPGLAFPGAELPSRAAVERLAAAPDLRAVAAGGTAVGSA